MTAPSAPRWWHEQNASLRSAAADDPSVAAQILADELVTLLDEVEVAFAVTGADTPGWKDPQIGADGTLRDTLEEEYSRCLDPGKYRILWARAEAWTRALTARGWTAASHLDGATEVQWADALPIAAHRTTVLTPHRTAAHELVLARTRADDGAEEKIPGLIIGAGRPAVPVDTIPICGCDACDSGSRHLLEDLDRTVLSVVDGSGDACAAESAAGHD